MSHKGQGQGSSLLTLHLLIVITFILFSLYVGFNKPTLFGPAPFGAPLSLFYIHQFGWEWSWCPFWISYFSRLVEIQEVARRHLWRFWVPVSIWENHQSLCPGSYDSVSLSYSFFGFTYCWRSTFAPSTFEDDHFTVDFISFSFGLMLWVLYKHFSFHIYLSILICWTWTFVHFSWVHIFC